MSTTDLPKTADYNAFFNSVLRRLRFALSLDDGATIGIFKLVDYKMEQEYLHGMMKQEEDSGFVPCRDKILALFLDGLIIKRRGKQDNPNAKPIKVLTGSDRLTNNDVLRKIRIAMSYREEDMMAILRLAEFNVGKSELSAFFRNTDHRSYRPCQDQLLRNFLQGMVLKYRPDAKQKK
ncbi:MAG: hypothetical protein ACJAVV_003079 [Alphaproteobacteria bacterium]|jgi:uncharacterized protein YehS (DUF1456 family)